MGFDKVEHWTVQHANGRSCNHGKPGKGNNQMALCPHLKHSTV
jgi:hypothetical protein